MEKCEQVGEITLSFWFWPPNKYVQSSSHCIKMASHTRKLLQRILHLKQPFTRSSRISRRKAQLQWRRLQDIPVCPASAKTIERVGYEIVSPLVEILLNIGRRVWAHLHTQWAENFWTMA